MDRALRDLPPRPAPRSLEERVLAEIARRQALPWWRKSFAHWPGSARILFVVVSLGVTGLVLLLSGWGTAGIEALPLRSAFAQEFAWFENARAVFQALQGFFEIIVRNIPPIWFYGALGFLAAMYAAFFGLGAAAYRALQTQR